MFTKLFQGLAPMAAVVAVESAKTPSKPNAAETPSKPESSGTEQTKARWICKPTELPIYTPLHEMDPPKRNQEHPPMDSKLYKTIHSGVRAVRVEVASVYQAFSKQKQNVEDFISTGVAHSQSTIDYLNEPDNTMPRVGAIAIGGLAGLILSIRGGYIKKIIYTGIGSGSIASLCYPKETEKFTQQGLIEARKNYAIAYNFVKGIKPGDQIGVEPVKYFPTSVDELKDLFANLVESAKQAVFSDKK